MSLDTIVLYVIALLIVAAAVFKGSRAPQPIASSIALPAAKIGNWAAAVPVVCAAVSLIAVERLGRASSEGLSNAPLALRVAVCGIIVLPWFVGAYFAFVAARSRNVTLRTVGALELAACVLCGAFYLIAVTVGLG